MPNWCDNELTIEGRPEQIADFWTKYVQRGFEFNRIVPVGTKEPTVYEATGVTDVNQAAKDARKAYPGCVIHAVLWQGDGYMPEAAA